MRVNCANKKIEASSRGILVIGPLPPPVHGASKNTRIIVDLLTRNNFCIVELNTTTSRARAHHRNVLFHATRAIHALKTAFKIARSRYNGYKVAYLVPDGGMGIAYTFLYAIILATAHFRVTIHHRNFSHIYKKSIFLKLINNYILKNANHIFLSPEMANRYISTYGPTKFKILDNINTNDCVPEYKLDSDEVRAVNVGFISNLSAEKGFLESAMAFEILYKTDDRTTFSIAGTPVSSVESHALDGLLERLGTRARWLGHLDGMQKELFFSQADVIVFPTKYSQEAQPNVIYEALAKGCYVISTDRACIPDMLGGMHSAIIKESVLTPQAIADAISDYIKIPDKSQLSREIIDQYIHNKELASAQMADFISSFIRK